MPMSDRTFEAALGRGAPTDSAEMAVAAVDVLTDSSLAHIVDLVAYVDDGALVVEVAATLGRLAGLSDDDVAGLDGVARTDLAEPGAASYVIGLLWDGANCNSLLHLAATGELPAVARLLERGCALAGGAVAEFRSNTLCNHTAALTGVGPGRHGIVNNGYCDREEGRQILANDSGTGHLATDLIRG